MYRCLTLDAKALSRICKQSDYTLIRNKIIILTPTSIVQILIIIIQILI